MLQWLTGKTVKPQFSGDLSVLQPGPLGEIQRLVGPFEILISKPARTERDITETLDACGDQLDWLGSLAGVTRPLRNAEDTWAGLHATEKVWRIACALDSPQLDDLSAVCVSLFDRAPWYPNPTRSRRWFADG